MISNYVINSPFSMYVTDRKSLKKVNLKPISPVHFQIYYDEIRGMYKAENDTLGILEREKTLKDLIHEIHCNVICLWRQYALSSKILSSNDKKIKDILVSSFKEVRN